MPYGIINRNRVMEGSDAPVTCNGKSYKGFYVSYNNYDTAAYGCITTALVLGQVEKFYILKGDHRKQYAEIIEKGFDSCLDYYKKHIVDAHEYSDEV